MMSVKQSDTDLRMMFLPISRSPPVVNENSLLPAEDPSSNTSSVFLCCTASLSSNIFSLESNIFLVRPERGSYWSNDTPVQTVEEPRSVEPDDQSTLVSGDQSPGVAGQPHLVQGVRHLVLEHLQ